MAKEMKKIDKEDLEQVTGGMVASLNSTSMGQFASVSDADAAFRAGNDTTQDATAGIDIVGRRRPR